MKRYKLINARLRKGLEQAELASEIGVKPSAVRRWEDGTHTPQPFYIGKLCDFFGVEHPADLNLDAQFNENASTHCREDELIAMLEAYDRRQLLDVLSRLSVFAGIDLTALFSTAVIAPERLLNICRAVVKKCWNLVDENGGAIADFLLSVSIPELENLATHASKHRHESILLAVEATTIQMVIAKRNFDFVRLVSLGEDAVRIAEMSRDGNIHAMALGWHGMTYSQDYYSQPETAIVTFNDALKCGDGISTLNKADIYIGLAKAYALCGNEKLARDFAELAQMTMPDHPELDPLYRYIRTGQSELKQRVGRVYLILAEKFPDKDKYAQTAYGALKDSTSERAISLGYRCQALLTKAEAACAIEDLNDYLNCLEEGTPAVRQMRSEEHTAKAITVLQKAPRGWRNEKRYIELRKLLTPNTAVVHQ